MTGTSFGNDHVAKGKSRHKELVYRLLTRIGHLDLGNDVTAAGVHVQWDGSFADAKQRDHVNRVYLRSECGRDGFMSSSVGVPLEAIDLPDGQFRDWFATVLLRSAERLASLARKKGADFDGNAYVKAWSIVLGRYCLARLPVPELQADAGFLELALRAQSYNSLSEALHAERIVLGRKEPLPEPPAPEVAAWLAELDRVCAAPDSEVDLALKEAVSRQEALGRVKS
jgi:hypothetical protein